MSIRDYWKNHSFDYTDLYPEYIVWNARLDEAVAGRNINNLRYADDTTLMAESEEELKSLLMKVKEESEKGGLFGAGAREWPREMLFCQQSSI